MTLRADLPRTLAFILISLAAVVGLAARIVIADRGPPVRLAAIQDLNRFAGQSIGGATLDGLEEKDIVSIRLRSGQCNDPVFAVPIPLTSVVVPDLADRAYGNIPGYTISNVYNGRVRGEFSRLPRLLARGLHGIHNVGASVFVRFYAPTICKIQNESFVMWADAILKLESTTADDSESD